MEVRGESQHAVQVLAAGEHLRAEAARARAGALPDGRRDARRLLGVIIIIISSSSSITIINIMIMNINSILSSVKRILFIIIFFLIRFYTMIRGIGIRISCKTTREGCKQAMCYNVKLTS